MLEIKAIGNLCQDAEIKDFNGQKLYGFTVATDESYTDKQGHKHEKTTYISCLKPIYNEQSTLGQYLKKGVKVFISGKPSAKGFATKDGNIGGGLNCKVEELELLGGGQKATATPPAAPQTSQVVSNQSTAQNGRQRAEFPANPAPAQPQYQMPLEKEDDLPF